MSNVETRAVTDDWKNESLNFFYFSPFSAADRKRSVGKQMWWAESANSFPKWKNLNEL